MVSVIIILAKKYKKALENNKKLSTAIQNQKEIINAFVEAERKANEDKSKLGQGTNSERLNHTLSILQNIELNN